MSLCEIHGASKIYHVQNILAFGRGVGQNIMDFGIFEHDVWSIERTGDRPDQVYRYLPPWS